MLGTRASVQPQNPHGGDKGSKSAPEFPCWGQWLQLSPGLPVLGTRLQVSPRTSVLGTRAPAQPQNPSARHRSSSPASGEPRQVRAVLGRWKHQLRVPRVSPTCTAGTTLLASPISYKSLIDTTAIINSLGFFSWVDWFPSFKAKHRCKCVQDHGNNSELNPFGFQTASAFTMSISTICTNCTQWNFLEVQL